MGWGDVHNGRCGIVEVLDSVLVHVRIIGHREAWLHGAKVMPGLDLRHSQGHHRAATNAVKGDLLDACQDIVQTVVEERALGVNDRRSRIRRQLEVLQLHCQG